MPHLDSAATSHDPPVTLKIVYYGPSDAGKTTTLRRLEARLSTTAPAHLLTLGGSHERTVYFDSLPVVLAVAERRIVLRLISVPGGRMHRPMRRLLLRGADGVLLLPAPDVPAPSQTDGGQDTVERRTDGAYTDPMAEATFDELRSSLRECGTLTSSVPVVRQGRPFQLSDESLILALRSVLHAAWPSVEHRPSSGRAMDVPSLADVDAAFLRAFGLPPGTSLATDAQSASDQAGCPVQSVPCGPRSLAMLWSAEARTAGRSPAGGATRS